MGVCQVTDMIGDCTFPGEFDSAQFGRVCYAHHLLETRPDADKAIAAIGMQRKPHPPGHYGKYTVAKADGTPTDPKADYFVLRLDTDTHARVAALAYADACEFKSPQLAADLRARVKRHVSSREEALEVAAGSMAREMRDEIDLEILNKLTTPPLTTFPKNGLLCSVCGQPQYETPSGPTCGEHGGAEGRKP
jgi:hypothetical protein